MGSEFVFEALKAHIRARGMTYKHIAAAIGVSEPTVKRIFSARDCTLSRLDRICAVVQVDLKELSRGASSQARLINQLSVKQEEALVGDLALFIVAVCTMQSLKLEDIVRTYRITEPQCIGLLVRLDRIGFIELMPNNRYRTLVARPFRWRPDGPIMRWTRAQASDYFDYRFDAPGEMLRVVNVRLSPESRQALISRLEQVAIEYAERHNADSWLSISQRQPLSLCLAVRPWEPEPFRRMRRRAGKPSPAR